MSLVRRTPEERAGRTVLLSDPSSHGWALEHVRLRDRILAGWRALTLDRELAAGCSTSSSRARAVRAGMLVAPAHREMLATSWENLLQPRASTRRTPVQWARVAAAGADVRELAEALRASRPVSPRGVAMASLLLTDGSGPVYHRYSRTDLAAAVRQAIQHLDPCDTTQPTDW